MNPKDKAKDLIESFEGALKVKDCVLICVNEILEVLENNESHWIYQRISYWHEVKKELEKLEK